MVKAITKALNLSIVILLIMSLSGCNHITSNINKDQEEYEILNDTCNIIINSLQQNDITAIYDILSPAALETDDLETGFNYSCQFFTEEISGIELSAGYSGGTTEHGTDRASNFRCGNATVTTPSGDSIDVWFEYWFNNDFAPDKVGVNRIKVHYTSEKFNNNYIAPSKYDRSGIYTPEWDNTIEQ